MLAGAGDATALDVVPGDIVSTTVYGDDLEIIFHPRTKEATR